MTNLALRPTIAPFLVLCALLAGCETLQERVRTTREVPTMTREFEASAGAVLAAAPAALARMGFSITETSSAHGLIAAISDIRRDAGMRSSKQIRLRFTVVDGDGGISRASLTAWEMREEENARGERFTNETGVVSPSFHNSVFDAVEQSLRAPVK